MQTLLTALPDRTSLSANMITQITPLLFHPSHDAKSLQRIQPHSKSQQNIYLLMEDHSNHYRPIVPIAKAIGCAQRKQQTDKQLSHHNFHTMLHRHTILERRVRKQRFFAGSAWGAITQHELYTEAEDGRGGRGETGTRGQRSSVDKCKVQHKAPPQRTINWIQKKKKKRILLNISSVSRKNSGYSDSIPENEIRSGRYCTMCILYAPGHLRRPTRQSLPDLECPFHAPKATENLAWS